MVLELRYDSSSSLNLIQETLQCGLMTTLGLDDEILMILPFLMVPLQLWLILKILRTFFMRDTVTLISINKNLA